MPSGMPSIRVCRKSFTLVESLAAENVAKLGSTQGTAATVEKLLSALHAECAGAWQEGIANQLRDILAEIMAAG